VDAAGLVSLRADKENLGEPGVVLTRLKCCMSLDAAGLASLGAGQGSLEVSFDPILVTMSHVSALVLQADSIRQPWSKETVRQIRHLSLSMPSC
jgi:hypothetical protein